MRTGDGCVLLFSGGRDSTLAAVRLAPRFRRLLLVTATSEHLVGIERVEARLAQLEGILPRGAEWLHIAIPVMPFRETLSYATCLPCQRAYIVAGAVIAGDRGMGDIATGYSGYQNTWPEQTPYAVARLGGLLAGHGLRLHLPVYDLISREEAMGALARAGLAAESCEQKCLRQADNVAIDGDILRAETDRWIAGISRALSMREAIPITLLGRRTLAPGGAPRRPRAAGGGSSSPPRPSSATWRRRRSSG